MNHEIDIHKLAWMLWQMQLGILVTFLLTLYTLGMANYRITSLETKVERLEALRHSPIGIAQ